jgi:hypothetical protein
MGKQNKNLQISVRDRSVLDSADATPRQWLSQSAIPQPESGVASVKAKIRLFSRQNGHSRIFD